MRLRSVLACVIGLIFGISAAAQTKISGTNHCAKPDPQTMVQVGDRPNHAFSVGQIKCACDVAVIKCNLLLRKILFHFAAEHSARLTV